MDLQATTRIVYNKGFNRPYRDIIKDLIAPTKIVSLFPC